MAGQEGLDKFVSDWREDELNLKGAFIEYLDFLAAQPGVELDFRARPGISYSLRARHAAQKDRELFTLVDVIDDDPKSRWLSVCFYADMISDPDETGDFVPGGLLGEDASCFNLDEDDPAARAYILARIREAAASAAQ